MSYALTSSSQAIQGIRNPAIVSLMNGVLLPVYIQDLAAKAVAVHAQLAYNATVPVTTSLTNPAHPRSLQIVFSGDWDSGDVTVAGTDQFGRSISEVIADTAGQTVEGTKIFKTVTSITWTAAAAGTIDVQTGPKIGLGFPIKSAWGICLANGVAELGTFDATYHAVTPDTSPDGGVDYLIVAPVDVRMAQNLNLVSL